MSEESGINEPTSQQSSPPQETPESESAGQRGVSSYKEFVPRNPMAQPQLAAPAGCASSGPVDMTFLFMMLAAIGVIFPMYWREKPDHCPNDASRWNTVFYLVEHGTYEYLPDWEASWTGGKGKLETEMSEEDRKQRPFHIGEKWYKSPQDIMPFWTIDFVSFEDEDGTRHYYSSKPPFLPTCVAGVVMTLEKLTGWNFKNQAYPWHLMRVTLIVVQMVPFLIFVWLMAKRVRTQSDSAWVRNFCIAAAALATFLTPYLTTLNNHVMAACAVMVAVYAFMKIWYDGRRGAVWFLLAGFFAAVAAALELPAVSLLVCVLCLLMAKNARKTLMVSLPAALLVVAAVLLTNWWGTGGRMLTPVYAQLGEEGGAYDFPGSYWMNPPPGIDALNEVKPIYLFNLLLGHHGFFLLTPIMFVALLGMVRHWFREDDRGQPLLACLVMMISMAVVGFYTFRTNNYGGTVQGARWLFWLIPLWLLMLPSGVEVLKGSRIGRGVCYLLLLLSLLTVVGAMPRPGNEAPPFSDSWAHKMQRAESLPDGFPDWIKIKY